MTDDPKAPADDDADSGESTEEDDDVKDPGGDEKDSESAGDGD